MNDMISRKSLIDFLKSELMAMKNKRIYKRESLTALTEGNGAIKILEEIISGVEKMPSASGWISTKEKLPKPEQDVLIYYAYWKGAEIQVAHLDCHALTFDICGEFNVGVNYVSHWQPLPEPPKEDNANG